MRSCSGVHSRAVPSSTAPDSIACLSAPQSAQAARFSGVLSSRPSGGKRFVNMTKSFLHWGDFFLPDNYMQKEP